MPARCAVRVFSIPHKKISSSAIESQAPVKLKTTQLSAARIQRTMMMGNRNGFLAVLFAMTTLLICCNLTSAFVNQTTIQQPTLSKGWSYFFEHPIPGGVPSSNAQFHVQAEEKLSGQQAIKQSAIGPAPVTVTPIVDPIVDPIKPPLLPKCGRGPNMPARSLNTDIKVGGGGASSATSPWPFLVNLRKSTDPPGVYFCSGSLISDRHVLLAAQCLERLSKCEISCLTVLLGQTNQYGLLSAVTRGVDKFVIHSLYNPLSYANDIAIIQMDSPVTFSTRIFPVCLPAQSPDPDEHDGIDAAVMGWGPTTPGSALALGAPSTALKQGKVMIMNLYTYCISLPSFFSPFVSANSHICVMTPANNKYTCMADIGGPVVINTQTTIPGWSLLPIWTQLGINSYTQDCATTGLKTRVSAFRDWINQQLQIFSG